MEGRTCGKCGVQPAGPGGVLCPGCKQTLTESLANYWRGADQAEAHSTAAQDTPIVS
jgi:hypothetical protein